MRYSSPNFFLIQNPSLYRELTQLVDKNIKKYLWFGPEIRHFFAKILVLFTYEP